MNNKLIKNIFTYAYFWIWIYYRDDVDDADGDGDDEDDASVVNAGEGAVADEEVTRAIYCEVYEQYDDLLHHLHSLGPVNI